MNEIPMSREQLTKYLGQLSDGAQITMCQSKDEVPITVRLVGETVKTENGTWISFLRSAQGLVVAVWVFTASTWPDYIKEPDAKLVAASAVFSALDLSFPFRQNSNQPLVLVQNNLPSGIAIQGTGYYIPPSGFQGGSLSF